MDCTEDTDDSADTDEDERARVTLHTHTGRCGDAPGGLTEFEFGGSAGQATTASSFAKVARRAAEGYYDTDAGSRKANIRRDTALARRIRRLHVSATRAQPRPPTMDKTTYADGGTGPCPRRPFFPVPVAARQRHPRKRGSCHARGLAEGLRTKLPDTARAHAIERPLATGGPAADSLVCDVAAERTIVTFMHEMDTELARCGDTCTRGDVAIRFCLAIDRARGEGTAQALLDRARPTGRTVFDYLRRLAHRAVDNSVDAAHIVDLTGEDTAEDGNATDDDDVDAAGKGIDAAGRPQRRHGGEAGVASPSTTTGVDAAHIVDLTGEDTAEDGSVTDDEVDAAGNGVDATGRPHGRHGSETGVASPPTTNGRGGAGGNCDTDNTVDLAGPVAADEKGTGNADATQACGPGTGGVNGGDDGARPRGPADPGTRLVPVRRLPTDGASPGASPRRSARRPRLPSRLHFGLDELRFNAMKERAHYNGLLEVRPSPIHGMGLFTCARVQPGTELTYIGTRLPSLSALQAKYATGYTSSYIMATGEDDDDHLDAQDVPCLARYANHSATAATAEFVATEGMVLLVIRPNLRAGAEVLVDYGPTYDLGYAGVRR